MEMVIPLMMASIVDNGVNKGNMQHILRIGVLMIIVALAGLAFGLLGGVFAAKASTGFARNLRKGMFENIQTFSFSNIDKYSVAGLVTRLTTDVTNLQNSYQMLLRMAFPKAETIQTRYTYLQDKPWLLPAAWVHRLIITRDTWQRHAREAQNILSADLTEVQKIKDLYDQLGL